MGCDSHIALGVTYTYYERRLLSWIRVIEYYGVVLWIIIVEYLSKWNPLGALSGSSSMGFYFHIALSVTYISMSVLHMLSKGMDFISNEVSLWIGCFKGRFGVLWREVLWISLFESPKGFLG